MNHRFHKLGSLSLAVAAIAAIDAGNVPARAESVEDFYRGKTINLYVGFSAGGGYDLWARFVARFMSAHIPGKPMIVVRNMPGAGSRTAAAYVYNIATKDGLSLNASEQALALEQALGDTLKFDVSKFNWIGSPNSDNKTVTTWHTSGIATLEDAKTREVTMGATANTTSTQYVRVMNALFGTKFKSILGYPGGNEINLAMQRSEIDGRGSASFATWKAMTSWMLERRLNFLVQVGLAKDEDLPHVPLLMDLADNAEDRIVLKLLSAPSAIGHPIVTSPGVPAERVKALRDAFDATMRDPAFLQDAKRQRLDIDAVSGAKLQSIVDDILSAPEPAKNRLRDLLHTGQRK